MSRIVYNIAKILYISTAGFTSMFLMVVVGYLIAFKGLNGITNDAGIHFFFDIAVTTGYLCILACTIYAKMKEEARAKAEKELFGKFLEEHGKNNG